MPDNRVEVLIQPDRIIRLEAEPHDVFAVINGLKLQHHSPLVRTFDPELNDWTCWQPTQEKAA